MTISENNKKIIYSLLVFPFPVAGIPILVYILPFYASNFNLGLGNNTNRSQPDIVENFRKDNINISRVCLQKFHSAFLSRSGQVMTCGHGRGGRLGHGSETMQLAPKGECEGDHLETYSPKVHIFSCTVAQPLYRPGPGCGPLCVSV